MGLERDVGAIVVEFIIIRLIEDEVRAVVIYADTDVYIEMLLETLPLGLDPRPNRPNKLKMREEGVVDARLSADDSTSRLLPLLP